MFAVARLQQGPRSCRALPLPRATNYAAEASKRLQEQYEASLLPAFSILDRGAARQRAGSLSEECAACLGVAAEDPREGFPGFAALPWVGSEPPDLAPRRVEVTNPIPEEERFEVAALLAASAPTWPGAAAGGGLQLDTPLLVGVEAKEDAGQDLHKLLRSCLIPTELPALEASDCAVRCKGHRYVPEPVEITTQQPPPRSGNPAEVLLQEPPDSCAGADGLLLAPMLEAPALGAEPDQGFSVSQVIKELAAPDGNEVLGPVADLSSLPGLSREELRLQLAPSMVELLPATTRQPAAALKLLDRLLPTESMQPVAELAAGVPIPHFEPPVLQALQAAASLDALEPLPEPELGWPPLRLEIPGCETLTMELLIAQELRLDEGPALLPAVSVDGEDGRQAESRRVWLSDLVASDCGGVRPVSTTHLSLHLDWSLSRAQKGVRPTALLAEQRELHASLAPRAVRVPADDERRGRQRVAILQQLLAHVPSAEPERSVLGPGAERQISAPAAALKGAVLPKAATPNAPQLAQPKPKPARADAAPAPNEGLSYFMQLHQPTAAKEAGGPKAAAQPAQSSSSSDATAEAIAAYGQSRARTAVQLELPPSHLQLLEHLREDERRLVAGCQGLSAEVVGSDFLSLEALQAALQQAAGVPSMRQQAKAYAAMAVVRQAAACLLHHGVRCAHLYLAQSVAELPGLLGGVTAVHDLGQMYEEVERGRAEEDHPKVAALRRLLSGTATLMPGAVVLAVGEAQSLFTLYQPALDAGLRPSHFDPGDELLGADAVQLLQALEQTCAAAREGGGGCVLVSSKHLLSGHFPLTLFQHIILCSTEPATQAALLPLLEETRCPQHVLAMRAVAWDDPRPGEQAARTAKPAPQARQVAAVHTRAAQPQLAADWPLVVTSDARRVVRQRRPLYEGLLQLEREGAGLVERPLSLLDLVLSPSAALIIHSNAEGLDLEPVLAGLAPVLQRVSYAFSRVVLVLEGPPGFQAQVLCGMDRLLALGRACGLHLQCFPSTSAATTEAVVLSAARAALTVWKAQGPGLRYALSGEPTLEESFLTRFFSINAHSAAVLTSLGLSMHQILHLGSAAGKVDIPLLALLPRHSLALFGQCAASGSPLLGVHGGEPHAEGASDNTAAGGGPYGGVAPSGDGLGWRGAGHRQQGGPGLELRQAHLPQAPAWHERVGAQQWQQRQLAEAQWGQQQQQQLELQGRRQAGYQDDWQYQDGLAPGPPRMHQPSQLQPTAELVWAAQQQEQQRLQQEQQRLQQEQQQRLLQQQQQQEEEEEQQLRWRMQQQQARRAAREAAAEEQQAAGFQGWDPQTEQQMGLLHRPGDSAVPRPAYGAGAAFDEGAFLSPQLLGAGAEGTWQIRGRPQGRAHDEDLQRSRRIIQSRLQAAPPHAAPAWPAVAVAAADDLLLGHDFEADLPASPLGRKRRWAAAAAGGWPGQEAAQQLPPWEAPAALGHSSRPALSLAGAWGGAAAGQVWRQQQGGRQALQDPDQDIQLDLSDGDSGHDATFSANISPFGGSRQHPAGLPARQGRTPLGLPLHAPPAAPNGRALISSFPESRPAQFDIPRLARPGGAQQRTTSSDEPSPDGPSGTPGSWASRPPGEFRHFQTGRKPAKKWTGGWRGYTSNKTTQKKKEPRGGGAQPRW